LIVPLFTTGPLTTAPNKQGVLSANIRTAILRRFMSAPSAVSIHASFGQSSRSIDEQVEARHRSKPVAARAFYLAHSV
jgi:hypothetical protein